MKRILLILTGSLMLTGCQYYRARDMSTGRTYITNNWQMYEDPWVGKLTLTDSRTGQQVTIRQYYQLDRLNEVETIEALNNGNN